MTNPTVNYYWTRRDGSQINIKDMNSGHLNNAIKLMDRKGPISDPKRQLIYDAMKKELAGRPKSTLMYVEETEYGISPVQKREALKIFGKLGT